VSGETALTGCFGGCFPVSELSFAGDSGGRFLPGVSGSAAGAIEAIGSAAGATAAAGSAAGAIEAIGSAAGATAAADFVSAGYENEF